MNVKQLEVGMSILIEDTICFVESINRLGNTSYCVNYITETGTRSREFFLSHDKVKLLDETEELTEKKTEGKKLNKPVRTPGGPKKFSVYVKNEKGNTVKVNFGDPNMEIKRDNPKRRKSFRARHNCDNAGPKTKARYWSCRQWRKSAPVADSYEPDGVLLNDSFLNKAKLLTTESKTEDSQLENNIARELTVKTKVKKPEAKKLAKIIMASKDLYTSTKGKGTK